MKKLLRDAGPKDLDLENATKTENQHSDNDDDNEDDQEDYMPSRPPARNLFALVWTPLMLFSILNLFL